MAGLRKPIQRRANIGALVDVFAGQQLLITFAGRSITPTHPLSVGKPPRHGAGEPRTADAGQRCKMITGLDTSALHQGHLAAQPQRIIAVDQTIVGDLAQLAFGSGQIASIIRTIGRAQMAGRSGHLDRGRGVASLACRGSRNGLVGLFAFGLGRRARRQHTEP